MAVIKDIDLWYNYVESVDKKASNRGKVINPREPLPTKRNKESSRFFQKGAESVLVSIDDSRVIHHTLDVIKLNRRERRNFAGEAVLDLHGSDRNIFPHLTAFCLGCIENKLRNVIIISGKGEGVLKNAVLEWLLSNISLVVGFFEIKDTKGESGAFGVRLRIRCMIPDG
jgi:DNA-nicking Smr family endonuclease